MHRLLIVLLGAFVALLATAPHATAASGPVDCGASTYLWVVDYHCTIGGFGAEGALYLCPPDMQCVSSVYCAAEVSPLTLGCNFP